MDYVIEYSTNEIYEYLRKSRSDDPMLTVEEVLEKHENILNDYVERNFKDKIPEENKFREVASSETIDGRPEMLRLLKGIESPKIKAILVVEVQRLSRGDLEDAGRLIKLLRYTNTKVITPHKIYNLNDDYDRDFFERELKRGNEYLEYFKKIQKRGRLESVKEGNYIGSVPPYGYDKIFVQEDKKKCPTLKINEEQAKVVQLIFDLYVNKNIGAQNICHELEKLEIKPPKGKYWSTASVKDMLHNIHYTGKVKWNWRKEVRTVENQEVIISRPKQENFLVYEGKHEAIISDELFEAAEAKRKHAHRAKGTTKIRNAFASILFCQCGKAMSMRTFSKSAARLSCDDQIHCNTGSVLYSDMVDRISEVLRNCIEEFRMQLENDNGSESDRHKAFIENIKRRLEALDKKEIVMWEAQSNPDPDCRMPQPIFKKLNANLQKEKNGLLAALQSASDNAPPDTIDYQDKIIRFSDALNALLDDSVSAEDKNIYLKNVIEKIEYTREKPVRLSKDFIKNNPDKTKYLYHNGQSWYAPPFDIKIQFK